MTSECSDVQNQDRALHRLLEKRVKYDFDRFADQVTSLPLLGFFP